jgi:hypothetical protein
MADEPVINPQVDTSKIIEQVTQSVSQSLEEKLGEQVKSSVAVVSKDITESIKEDVVGKITSALTGGVSQEDLSPWAREKRNPKSYEEVAEWSKLQAEKAIDAKLAEKESAAKAAKDEAEKTQTQKTAEMNQYWDQQLTSMVADQRLPAVSEAVQEKLAKNQPLTDEDRQDAGIEARKRLFELGTEHKETNLELVYFKYYLPEQQNKDKPSGSSAPVIGNAKSPSKNPGEFSYEELHGGSMFDHAKSVHGS